MRKSRRLKSISDPEFADLMYQLGFYTSTGLPFAEVVQIVDTGQETKMLKRHLGAVQAGLDRGKSLADTLAEQYPKQLKPFMASLLQSAKGDETADALFKIGKFLESIHLDTGRVKAALVYPLIVSLVAVMVCVMLLTFVVPVFEEMFASFGSALPVPTQAVIAVSEFFRQSFGSFLLLVGIVVAAGWLLDRKWTRFNAFRSRIIRRLPSIGKLRTLSATHVFLRTIILMLEDGQSLPLALEAASQTAEKRFYRNAIRALKSEVVRGANLSQALGEANIFPAQITGLASMMEGNASAAVPLLARLADRYQVLTRKAVQNFSKALQPLLIVIVGILVGGLVFAMYLPIFKMGGVIGG